MNGFFFGTSQKPLYGYYHPPESAERGQVLFCQPWGVEYELAHRTLHVLARRLASSGWHVLRFDGRGCGDSWGGTAEGDLEAWRADTVQAAAELRAISGLVPLQVVGLRLGATLAALSCAEMAPVTRCVMWDPILDGSDWMKQLQRLDAPGPAAGRLELGRYTVSPLLRQQLADLEASHVPAPEAETLVLQTARPFPATPWGAEMCLERLEQPSPWVEDVAIGSGQLPVEAVSRIVEWLGE